MKPRSVWSFVFLSSALACARNAEQSALDPAGQQAQAIFHLLNFMLVVSVVVYAVVMLGMALVAWRRSRPAPNDEERSPERERDARRWVVVALSVTLAILFGVLIYDLAVQRRLLALESSSPISIRVTGHRWWWEVEYDDPVPQRRVRLANELHMPVGQALRIALDSHDVIHSFWVPNLGGKKDLIPGHDDEIWLRADRPGVYRVQCAEFCGIEHAKMAMFVVAETPEQFSAWLEHQRMPAPAPTTEVAARGRRVFEDAPCSVCHTVLSTKAAGRVGPDLTHVAGRLSLAAGTLHNTPGDLAGWILDPQTIKPGAQMPPHAFSPSDLHALVTYLRTLR